MTATAMTKLRPSTSRACSARAPRLETARSVRAPREARSGGAAVGSPRPTASAPAPALQETTLSLDILLERADLDALRPKTRAACVDGPRPCPWVTCQHHIWPEVAFVPRRTRYRYRGKDAPMPWEMVQTCTLDVADEGGMTLEEVGEILGLTRERVRQLEARALARLGKYFRPDERSAIIEWFGEQ